MPGNIVLIGMSGCGKSTLGRELAKELGLLFADTDEEIERTERRNVGEIFASDGEDFFRVCETREIRNVCQKCGLVIAVGGGAVTRPENMEFLKQNGVVVYVKRSCLSIVATADLNGRPLLASDPQRITALFAQREPLYEQYADVTVENEGSIAGAVQRIRSELRGKM